MERVFKILLRSETPCFARHGNVLNRTSKSLHWGTDIGVGPIEQLRFGGRNVDAVPIEWKDGEGTTYLLVSAIQTRGIKAQLERFFVDGVSSTTDAGGQ